MALNNSISRSAFWVARQRTRSSDYVVAAHSVPVHSIYILMLLFPHKPSEKHWKSRRKFFLEYFSFPSPQSQLNFVLWNFSEMASNTARLNFLIQVNFLTLNYTHFAGIICTLSVLPASLKMFQRCLWILHWFWLLMSNFWIECCRRRKMYVETHRIYRSIMDKYWQP